MINARETCKKWVQVLMINYIISLFVRVKTLFSFCWNSIPCLTRKKILLYQNFSSFSSPHASISIFHSVIYFRTHENPPTWNKLIRLLSIKLHYTNFSFACIYASYHSLFSILSGYGIMFMHLSRKSDSKKSLGILRTSEYFATSIICSSVA